jgi:hypothetical protein
MHFSVPRFEMPGQWTHIPNVEQWTHIASVLLWTTI